MKRLKAVITLVLVFAVALTFYGCGGNTKNENSNPDKTPTNQTQAESPLSAVKRTQEIDKSTLKLQKITVSLPKECKTIGKISAYGDIVVFSAGTDKPVSKLPPCLTYIENLYLYNIKTKHIDKIAHIDKGFAQIYPDCVNSNWIVYSEIANDGPGPKNVYAINRKTGEKEFILHEKGYFNDNHFEQLMVTEIKDDNILLKRYSPQITKRAKDGAISDGIVTNSIGIINLKNIKAGEKEIFKDSAHFNENANVQGETINKNYVAFDYAKNNTLHIYLYDLTSGKLSNLLDAPFDENKENLINVALTEDNYLVFSMPSDDGNYQEVIAPLADFSKKEVLAKSLNPQNRTLLPDKIISTNYIVWRTYNFNNDETKNKLYIFNRTTGTLNIINWYSIGNIYFVGKDKIAVNEPHHYGMPDDTSAVLYLLDLKANGF